MKYKNLYTRSLYFSVSKDKSCKLPKNDFLSKLYMLNKQEETSESTQNKTAGSHRESFDKIV